MPKNIKPGWTYIYSRELEQEIALNDKTNWVYCHDGTRYNPQELQIIKINETLPRAVHLIKKIFEGEIVIHGTKRLSGRTPNKPAESRQTDSQNRSRNPGGNVSANDSLLPDYATGQLEIF